MVTRDDIIRMAREAGLHEDDGVWYSRSEVDADVTTDDLEHFATLVAAAEREACARIAEIAFPFHCEDLIRARDE